MGRQASHGAVIGRGSMTGSRSTSSCRSLVCGAAHGWIADVTCSATTIRARRDEWMPRRRGRDLLERPAVGSRRARREWFADGDIDSLRTALAWCDASAAHVAQRCGLPSVTDQSTSTTSEGRRFASASDERQAFAGREDAPWLAMSYPSEGARRMVEASRASDATGFRHPRYRSHPTRAPSSFNSLRRTRRLREEYAVRRPGRVPGRPD